MASLLIVPPARPAAVLGGADLALALTPDPKEAGIIPAAGIAMTVDYGQPVTIDTAFIGYHSVSALREWTVLPTNASGQVVGDPLFPARSTIAPGFAPPQHGFIRAPTPSTSRYWQYQISEGATAAYAGVLAVGLAFQPSLGNEYGSGRPITDTGSADRTLGGGFAINEGVTAGGWQWTMGDLTDLELRQLYRLAKAQGTTRSVLVVEDPDQTDGLNERIHWGLFQKLDPYERILPGATRWAMRVDDWA